MKHLRHLLGVGILIALVSTAGAQSWLTNGLVAYYPCNGNADDAVGTNHGTVFAASLSADRFGVSNRSYSFNGIDAYIECPDTGLPAGNSARTVSLWLKIDSLGDPRTITYPFSYGVDGPHDAFYAIADGINAGNPFLAMGRSGGGDTPRMANLQMNVWQHLVITYSNEVATIYLDGQGVAAPRSFDTTLSGRFYIGRYLGGFPPTLFGSVDDVRIYSRALPANEVKRLYALESGRVLNLRTAVYVDSDLLTIGTNYQLQGSGDLNTWTNLGVAFTATNTTWRATNYWDVDDSERLFFRLRPQ